MLSRLPATAPAYAPAMNTAIYMAGASGPTLVVGNVESIVQALNEPAKLVQLNRLTRDGAGPAIFVNVDHVVYIEAHAV